MTQFISRTYNSFELNETRGVITKSSVRERLRDEINYYKSLPANLSIFFPKLQDSYCRDGKHFLELEYYPYNDVGSLMVEKDFRTNKHLWREIFNRLKDILKEFHSHTTAGKKRCFEKMYIEKTLNEYKKLKQTFLGFEKICGADMLVINGRVYKNFEGIWPQIEPLVKKMFGASFTAIHGDLCFSNILYNLDKNGRVTLKLIDPRGDFGQTSYLGDYRYDLAKLFHSFDGGYEYIIRDSFSLRCEKNILDFEFTNDHRREIEKIFFEIFGTADFFSDHIKEFNILQGLIFIGMCARHYDSLERQKIMYATGVKILNECLKQRI